MNYSSGNQGNYIQNQQQNAHMKRIQDAMNSIYTLQNQPEIGQLIQHVSQQQANVKQEIQQCFSTQGITRQDEHMAKAIRERCNKIKKRNEHLLQTICNLRQKMSKLMHLSIEKEPKYEQEYVNTLEQIRKTSMSINDKLYTLKQSASLKHGAKDRNTHQFTPMKLALTEMKDGTETMSKQMLKKKYEINQLIKHLHINH